MSKYTEEIVTSREIVCKNCGFDEFWKSGFDTSGLQCLKCKRCEHRYSQKDTYIGYRYRKQYVIRALEYFYGGLSFGIVRNKFDNLDNIKMSRYTIWNWVTHFTNLVIPYTRHLKPTNIGDVWYADETMIALHGKNRWLWAVLDESTRYLLACKLTTNRTTKHATELFYDAYVHASRKPQSITTDKLQAYEGAFKKVFYSRYKGRPEHLQSGGFGSPTNTNLIERWNEYIKARTKVMRYFKKPKSAFTILQGIIINYNYLWEHSSIGSVPPAQVAGIDIKKLGIKNWGDLIELALKYDKRVVNPSEGVWFVGEKDRVEKEVSVC